jgi:hypothetical protein
MNFEVGSILIVRDYKLPTKIKDKFFIVIGKGENEITLLSMTTSQVYFDTSLIKHGEIIDRDMSIYCFEKHKVIGINGFAFHKNTFIYHKRSIHSFSAEKLNALSIECLDCLIKGEIIELIYSFYKKTPLKFKGIFEKILFEISK